ncbi:cupin [Desulfuromonas versatilis]|uniref:Cupin n=1 Tax=Desulfuromonas versatilis TaxID=2802975 RepID=A0ABN6DWJ8_9BACT|nr:cupin domain-containing protein [Desulfuromonas versatilis]BCR04229.1 cupin [Desulfuromonas versatilis]
MRDISVKHNPPRAELEKLGVFSWPIWEKDVSDFPWTYGEREVCYLLEGEVTVTPQGGGPVTFGTGDLVSFPAGMSCFWQVTRAVRKHYRFG